MGIEGLRHRRAIFYPALALGLFAYALFIRWTLLQALRDPIFTPDSTTYLHPVFSFLGQGKFELDNQRTLGYPLFLFCLLRKTHSFLPVLLAQHGLTLATAILAAFLYYRFFEKSAGRALVLFFWISLLPQEVAYGQMILTETLYTFLVMLFFVSFFYGATNPKSTAWLFAGLAVSAALLTRPIGWSLFITALCALPFFHKGRLLQRSALLFFLPVAIILGMSFRYNQLQRGFTGFDQLGGVVLFDSTARFLEVESIPDKALRELLLPVWEKHRREIDNPNWVYSSPDSPVQAIQHDPRFKDRAMSVMTLLALRAINDHPVRFLSRQVRLLIYFFREGSIPYLLPKAKTLLDGLLIYWNATLSYPPARDWLIFKPANARAYIDHVEHSPAYPYQTSMPLTRPLSVIPQTMQGLPTAALLACLFLFRRREVRPYVLCFLGVIILHILLTNLARGIESEVRYAIPLEPLYCILILAGLSDLVRSVYNTHP